MKATPTLLLRPATNERLALPTGAWSSTPSDIQVDSRHQQLEERLLPVCYMQYLRITHMRNTYNMRSVQNLLFLVPTASSFVKETKFNSP